MKKPILWICPVFIAAVMVIGACGKGMADTMPSATKDPSVVVVAEVNGIPIYKDLYTLQYQSIKEDLERTKINATDDEISDMALSLLIKPMVLESKLKELGYYEMTEERQVQVQAYVQGLIDYYLIREYLGAEYTQEELEAARESYQDEVIKNYFYSLTFEQMKEAYLQLAVEEAAKEDLVGETVPTEEQLQEYYNDNVIKCKQAYEKDPTIYVSAILNGFAPCYIPDGVRRVRQALIPLDEKSQAQDVLSRLESGELTFDEAMAKYPDKSMPERGYPVVAGDDNYSAEFTEAALGIPNIGGITGLIETDLGYCIIEYYADEAEGSVPFESVYDTIYENAVNSLKEQAWQTMIDGWKEEMNVIIFKDNLN